jgi:thioredoxin-related protein
MQIRFLPIILFIILSFTSSAQKTSVFIEEDWDKALELAKKSRKPIIVDFYTEWCGWCEEMDKKTFKDSLVSVRLGNEFVAVKLDAEREIGKKIAMKYRVNSFPTIGYFESNGKLIKKIAGFKEPVNFHKDLDVINEYVNSEHSEPFPGITAKLNPGFPEMYTKSFGPNGKREFPKKEEVQKWFSEHRTEWETEVYFSMLFKFNSLCDEETINTFLNRKARYVYLFGEEDVISIVDGIIGTQFYRSLKNKSEAGLDSLLLDLPKYMEEESKITETRQYLRLTFFTRTENYKALSNLIEKSDSKSISNYDLNDYAWSIYLKSADTLVLKKALQWMAKVIKEEPNYMYLDTYASLAFKLGDYSLAKEFAEEAIKVGSSSGDNTTETEELLKKIEEMR